MFNDHRQMRFFTTETRPGNEIRHISTPGTVLTQAERQRVDTQLRPFSQVLADQRQWVIDHAPFDTVVKLPIMQFVTIGSEEHQKISGALIPFKDPSLTVPSNHPDHYELTDHAMKQLLSRLQYDRKLFDRLAGAGKLNTLNINYLIQTYYNELVMLRCIDQNKVRGFLTDSYEPFDNIELFEAVEPYMDGAETRWDYSDEKVTHLSVTWPSTATEIKVGDVVKTGIHISNSEVGLRSVTIASYVYRLKCSNGLIGGGNEGGLFRFRHTGDGDNLRNKIKAAIESTYMETSKIIAQFREALNKQINDPATYLENIAKDKGNNVTQEQFKNMLNAYLIEPDPNLYGVVNAITRTANQYYIGETRYELERLANKTLQQGLK